MAQARALEGQMCEECSGWIRRRGRELRIVDSPPANRYRAVEPPAVYCALYNVKLNVTTTTIIKMKNNRELFVTKATLKKNRRKSGSVGEGQRHHNDRMHLSMFCVFKMCFSMGIINLQLTKISNWLIVLSHQKNNIKNGVKRINFRFYLICKQYLGHEPPPLIRSVSPLVMCCYGWAVLQNRLCLFSCFRLAAETLGGCREFTTPTHQMKDEMMEGERKNERDEEEGWVQWSSKIRWWWCLFLITDPEQLLYDLRKKCIWET